MKVRATINILACEQELDRDGKPVVQKNGEKKFRVAHETTRKVKVGSKEIDAKEVETMTSLVELKPGVQEVELNLFAIAQGAKATIYYQVARLVEQQSKPKNAA